MRTGKFCAALAFLALLTTPIKADPLPGEVLLFTQRPMVETHLFSPTPYFGHDEASTAVQLPVGAPFDVYGGPFMADDFAFRSNQAITHVKFWGGYLSNPSGEAAQRFFISIESDVPASPTGGFSRPGEALLSQIVTAGPILPGSGTFTEKLIRPKGGAPQQTPLYEYNAELETPFVATANTVYWLKVVALTEQVAPGGGKFEWGWHNRDYTVSNPLAATPPGVNPGEFVIVSPIPEQPPIWHFQDDAVAGTVSITDHLSPGANRFIVNQSNMSPKNYLAEWDGPNYIANFSKDLAFELYGVPEPSTALLGLSAAAVMLVRRRY